MKVVIIEDERHNISRLKRILQEIEPNTKVVAVLQTVKESVLWFNQKNNADVALVDIRLLDGLSFDIMEQVDVTCPIIFTTSYHEYALRAFKVNSIDYLLKPIEKEELSAALQKAKNTNQGTNLIPDLTQLLQQVKGSENIYRKRFLLPKHDGYKVILVEEIEYIYSENKITYLALLDGKKEVVSHSLEDLENELNPNCFFRVNRQYIITVGSIANLTNSFNGKLKLSLQKNGPKEIIICRDKAPFFKRWLDQ